jgi:phosphopantothenate-cysteine ligase
LLIPKSRGALKRYGHQLVIGNNLVRRKFEVVFVEPDPAPAGGHAGGLATGDSRQGYKETWLRLADLKPREGVEERDIEEMIIEELLVRHERWIAAGSARGE